MHRNLVMMNSEPATLKCLLSNGTFGKRFPLSTFIDRGCSGLVYRVKDCMDEKEYAVKKIIVKQTEDEALSLQSIFRKPQKEVVRLARVGDHVNIVGYITAWFEETSYSLQVSVASNDGETSDVEFDQLLQVASVSRIQSTMSTSSGESLVDGTMSISNSQNRPAYTLFIQMELCMTSLHHWLKERNIFMKDAGYKPKFEQLHGWVKPQSRTAQQLFELVEKTATNACLEGIVRGLNHMHCKGYAHRDLHLRNILISVNEQGVMIPKLSDFGSAKTLERLSSQLADIQLSQLSQAIGSQDETFGSDPNSFAKESKDDMQHLAEIILRLYYPDGLTKESEKYLDERDWKFGEIEEYQSFGGCFPHQAKWIELLKNDKHVQRPTAVEILRNGTKHDIFKSSRLEADILKAENKRLSDENLEKDKEIKRLRLQLGQKPYSPSKK